MHSFNSWAIILGLTVAQLLFSQTISVQDTIRLQKNVNQYKLTNNFIYQSSIQIEVDGLQANVDSIDHINGIVYWENDYERPINAVIAYKALDRDIPVFIGPAWKELPTLDSLINKSYVPDNIYYQNMNISEDNLFTSGTFNRQINFSTLGMSEFSGGLHLNISGELDKDIMLSAVLSDQEMMIQPDGNTRNLEDLEQVYITIQHPKFSVDAGDLVYVNKTDKLINIERSLVGINNNFKYNNITGNALIASTRGKYIALDLEAKDGIQGPYRLSSKEYNKDISLLSGSEKVWLNGDLMIRGANYDYVVDYSLAEITFTPKHLIHFDSDIFVEYEYIDGQYSQNLISGSYKKNISENFSVIAGMIREKDNTNNLSAENSLFENMASGDASKLYINGAVKDSSGDYYYDGEVYIYDPNYLIAEYLRYQVTFSYDGAGEYERIISNNGKIYYQYLDQDNDETSKDLYSPYQKVKAPRSKDLIYAKGVYGLGNKLSISTLFSRSNLDNNILSGFNASDKGGLYEVSFSIDSIETGRIRYGISGSNSVREKKYTSFGLDRNVRFKRFWDLDSLGLLNERESTLKLFIDIDELSSSFLELSKLNIGDFEKGKVKIDHTIHNGSLQGTRLTHQQVISLTGIYKFTDAIIKLQSGSVSPFFHFQEEKKPGSLNYSTVGVGLGYKKEKKTINIGFDRRKDSYSVFSDNLPIEKQSEDLISSIQYLNQNRKGWRNRIILKQRFKQLGDSEPSLKYLLGRVKLFYKNPESPIQFEMNTSTERTQNESYSVVYDSLGIGLGEYRFDEDFNTFISDPNGAYIAYSVPTGDRTEMININGFQRMVFDFEKLKGYPSLMLRMETSYDYSGSNYSLNGLFRPSISDTTLFRSYVNNLIEIDWKESSSMKRVRTYNIFTYDLQGYDPRGNELFKHLEAGIDYHSTLRKNANYKISGLHYQKEVRSSFSELRYRNIDGSWYEIRLYTKNMYNIDSEISIKYGADKGKDYLNNFSAYGVGIEYNGRLFLGESGSLQSNISWQENKEKSNIRILPPEALNGLTIGKNINASTRVNYFFNRNMSFSFSINFIDNYRYNNMFTVLGEFRAYL